MRKKSALIALVILALGLVGISLSTLYTQNEYSGNPPIVTVKESYGFPLNWYGYSFQEVGIPSPHPPPRIYWFSLESLLLDASFWFAISFFVSFVAIKSARALNLVAIAHASVLGIKTSIMLLVMSLSLIAIGIGLCLASGPIVIRPYPDLGLRLIGSGTIALIATLSVILWKPSNVSAPIGAQTPQTSVKCKAR